MSGIDVTMPFLPFFFTSSDFDTNLTFRTGIWHTGYSCSIGNVHTKFDFSRVFVCFFLSWVPVGIDEQTNVMRVINATYARAECHSFIHFLIAKSQCQQNQNAFVVTDDKNILR